MLVESSKNHFVQESHFSSSNFCCNFHSSLLISISDGIPAHQLRTVRNRSPNNRVQEISSLKPILNFVEFFSKTNGGDQSPSQKSTKEFKSPQLTDYFRLSHYHWI